ncbi:secretory carrier membrane family protein [Striga asiatica]|uniref:Secretory carrier-associated membrane protein n=1 Tax=Striga asiatica TaxID=4170 RepID=A0A5A7QWN6_STRAF|nr:secretory carrier membrane family protein [Striga asiatica]
MFSARRSQDLRACHYICPDGLSPFICIVLVFLVLFALHWFVHSCCNCPHPIVFHGRSLTGIPAAIDLFSDHVLVGIFYLVGFALFCLETLLSLWVLQKVPPISPGYPLAALDMVLQNKAVFGMKMNDLHTNDPTYPDYVLLSYPHEFSIHGVRDPTKSGNQLNYGISGIPHWRQVADFRKEVQKWGPAFVAKLKLYWPDLRPPRRRKLWSFWKSQYDKHIAHPQTGLEVLDFFRLAVRMFEQLETPYLAIPRGISLDVSDFLNGYLNPAGHPPGLYRKVFVPVGDFCYHSVFLKHFEMSIFLLSI